jgi:hypothetical protein
MQTLLPQSLQDLVNGWPMIEANPVTFIAILVVMLVAVWIALSYLYGQRIASKDAQIQLLDRQVADYKDKLHGASPDQAKARIDALEARLGQFEPRRLTDNQRKILIERARVNDHELTIICEASSDCMTYAAAFEAPLREAGWTVYNYQIPNPPQRPRTGIAVQVPDLNNLSKEAGLLRTALQAAQVDIELMHMKDFPAKSPVQLLITAKAS